MNNTLLKSEDRAATAHSADQVVPQGRRGTTIVLDITKAPNANDTLTVSIEAKDPASGKYVPLTAFAASKKGSELGEGGTLAFTLYPAAAETAAIANHESQALPLPAKWRVTVTHSAGGTWTYSLGCLALN